METSAVNMKLIETKEDKPIRGFIFTCSNKTEAECFERQLFGTGIAYDPVVIRIRKGDLLFLVNLDTDIIYGIFKAISNGGFKLIPDALKGKYPYQVKVKPLDQVINLEYASKILKKIWNKKKYTLIW